MRAVSGADMFVMLRRGQGYLLNSMTLSIDCVHGIGTSSLLAKMHIALSEWARRVSQSKRAQTTNAYAPITNAKNRSISFSHFIFFNNSSMTLKKVLMNLRLRAYNALNETG